MPNLTNAYRPQFNAAGELLGQCEHCGQIVTLAHWSINPTVIRTDYGTEAIAYDPQCLAR